MPYVILIIYRSYYIVKKTGHNPSNAKQALFEIKGVDVPKSDTVSRLVSIILIIVIRLWKEVRRFRPAIL